jgi:response regulator RpfG family c-di-GMP phosphodiesterase
MLIGSTRLPDGDGAAFLQQAAARWPDTARLLLIEATDPILIEAAIERAGASYWLHAPSREGELRLAVKQALHQRFAEFERRRLTALVQRQQQDLDKAETRLHTRGTASSDELRQTISFLEATQEELHKSYASVIKLCANLVGLRDPAMAAYSRVVAEQAHALALRLGMDESAARDVLYAGLLHHIGKLGLPDQLLSKPFEALTPTEHVEMNRYPVVGASLLIAIQPLQGAARIIRAQNECFDGHGQPDGQAGEQIPLGARVLAVVKAYHAVQRGSFDGRHHTAVQAVDFLRKNRGRRYDPAVVDAFLDVLDSLRRHLIAEPVLCVTSSDLRPGMILARDVVTDSGAALLTKDHVLDDDLISRIRQAERTSGEGLTIFVWGRRSGSGTDTPRSR